VARFPAPPFLVRRGTERPPPRVNPLRAFVPHPSPSFPALASVRGGGFATKPTPPRRRRLLYLLIILNDQSHDNSTSCDARSQDGRASPSDPRLPGGMPDY